MARHNQYLVLKLVEGGILYLNKDMTTWDIEVSDDTWIGDLSTSRELSKERPGSQIDRSYKLSAENLKL